MLGMTAFTCGGRVLFHLNIAVLGKEGYVGSLVNLQLLFASL